MSKEKLLKLCKDNDILRLGREDGFSLPEAIAFLEKDVQEAQILKECGLPAQLEYLLS